ncbi:hypothetical protein AVEN_127518-1 [Araneus ventricosus]|uniref:Pre-C2HC domain-containing protein n=1 Tax=Araneus ventricosus TaxID=182803 RepID=A0A4Y2MJ97_ARAVE|nr:hypothetical protein AVEN_127518-1 [Araneus ventricosus]
MPTKTRENAAIYRLTSTDYYKVTVEDLRRKGSQGQCFKCQQYFHNSRPRQREPVCMKCAISHETRNSPKPSETPVKCTNCEGDHTAKYASCPENTLQLKKSAERA